MDVFIELIQRIGFMIREINEMIHFPLKLDTSLSWGTVILAIALYVIVNEFLNSKELSSSGLIKLVAIYILILGVIVATYADIGKLILKVLNTESEKSRTFLAVAVGWVFILTLLIGWMGTSKDEKKKMQLVLGALYLPVLILIITNGKILEEDFETIKGFTPRFKVPFASSNTSPRVEKVKLRRLCCRWIDPEEIETVIDSHPSVSKSIVSVKEDADGIVRPYAFVVLDSVFMEPDDLEKVSSQGKLRTMKKKIIKFVRGRFERYNIQNYKIPHWIEFIRESEVSKIREGNVD